jgi:uncharacterized protein (DUF1786 family)
MDYLAERLGRDPRLSTFAAYAGDVPEIMTRLRALAESAVEQTQGPVVVMDTAPAAVLGALDDPLVLARSDAMVVNIGNFHTLAFQFYEGRICRLFEHHTGILTPETLGRWTDGLAGATISHADVFADHGHGAIVLDPRPVRRQFVAVTGPRRSMARAAGLPAHYAVPHGDQMLAGCFGLVRACADVEPAWREQITTALNGETDRSLW